METIIETMGKKLNITSTKRIINYNNNVYMKMKRWTLMWLPYFYETGQSGWVSFEQILF